MSIKKYNDFLNEGNETLNTFVLIRFGTGIKPEVTEVLQANAKGRPNFIAGHGMFITEFKTEKTYEEMTSLFDDLNIKYVLIDKDEAISGGEAVRTVGATGNVSGTAPVGNLNKAQITAKIKTLERSLAAAVTAENYEQAKTIKGQIENWKAKLNPPAGGAAPEERGN